MKKKSLSMVLIINMILMLFSNIVMASPESNLITKLDSVRTKPIVETYYDDFDNNGTYEMFAFTGNVYEADETFPKTFFGDIWFVSETKTEMIEGRVDCSIGSGFAPTIFSQNDLKQLATFKTFQNGQIETRIYSINDNKIVVADFKGYLMQKGQDFILCNSTYDSIIEKNDFNSGIYSGSTRTWKNYWYYIDTVSSEFREYGGTEITKEEFLRFNGSQDILNLITNGEIYNILYRDNGIININIIAQGSLFTNNDSYVCSNILVGYDDNSVWTIDDQHSDAPDDYRSPIYSGFYLPALNEDIAVYPDFKKNSTIKVILNGTELTFDQAPIMDPAGRVLVPIRKIAEAMGDDVKWNQDLQTAFVKHKDRALIIPLYDDYLYIAYSDKVSDWRKYALDVPSQEQNGRTLTPVRAFCESLGANVNWDDSTRTVSIEYDYNSGNEPLPDECIPGINMAYSIFRNHNNISFQKYTNEIYDFLESRGTVLDSTAMWWGNGFFDGIVQAISGENAEKTAIKTSLSQIIAELAESELNDSDMIETINGISYTKGGAEAASTLLSLPKENLIINNIDDLEKLSDCVPELKALSKEIGAVEVLAMGTDEVCYLLADYAQNIKYLNDIETYFKETSIDDDVIYEAIDEIRDEYTTKWIHTVKSLRDKGIDTILSILADTSTGGIFSVISFAKDLTNEFTGLSTTADGLYEFYAICRVNGAFDLAYQRMYSNIANTSYNPENMKGFFDLQKAVKITAYKSMNKIANAVDEISWDNRINEINNMTYILWK